MHKKAKVAIAVFGVLALFMIAAQFIRMPFFAVHPHEAIPAHTALFFAVQKTQLQQIADGSPPKWMDELFLPQVLQAETSTYLNQFESILPLPDEEQIFVCLNPTRSSGIDLLFILPNTQNTELEEVLNSDPQNRVRVSTFQNFKVFTVYREDKTYSFSQYRNLLLFARHAYLVENAISQLKSPSSSICKDKGFRSLGQGQIVHQKLEEPIEIALNISALGTHFSPLIEPSSLFQINQIGQKISWLRIIANAESEMAEWEVDLSFKQAHPVLEASHGANSVQADAAFAFLPDDLTGFVSLGQEGFHPQNEVNLWKENFGKWVGNNFVFAVGEQLGKSPAEKFILLKTKESDAAESALEAMALDSSIAQEFQMFKIWDLGANRISEMFDLPGLMHNVYATSLGEYILFGNSESGMERWLVKFLAGQTFAQKASFLQLRGGLTDKNQILYYFESSATWQILSQFLSADQNAYYQHNPLLFSHLVGVGSWKNGRLHCQLATPTEEKKESEPASILWQVPLNGQAKGMPLVSKNPESGENEIVVQDHQSNIYLVSDNGRILWQRNFKEPILSAIHEIDLRNDRERQFVFNTRSAIHMLDESGRDVVGYPLLLQVPASNGVTVVDFFESKDYRFFIACENGKAYGFDERGSPVEGWRPKDEVGQVQHPLLHFQARGMDFLALLNEKGTLHVFQKNGNYRFPKVELESVFLQGLDYQSHPLSSRLVTADDEGRVYAINLAGDYFRLVLRAGNNDDVKFAFVDVVGDARKDYIVVSGNNLAAYYYNGTEFLKAFSHQFNAEPDEVFGLQYPKGKKEGIGLIDRLKKRIYLLDGTGKSATDFPLEGTTPFVIEDLLRNGRLVTVTGNGRSICAYSLN